MNATAAAWAGLGLAIFDLLVWFALAFGLTRLWAKLRPQVEPLLSMFAPPPPPSPPRETTEIVRGPYSFAERVTPPADDDGEG